MLPTARLPTVEFRSLLLPPIRIRLRTLHTFIRPQCASVVLQGAHPAATCHVQRRSLHLYKTAKAKTALGMHKILDFNLYQPELPSASSHRVNLVRSELDLRPIAKDVSLQELYDKHISPGRFLYMAQPVSKKLSEDFEKMRDENVPSQHKNYAIVSARSFEVKLKTPQAERKQLGALKGIHLLLANPVEYTKIAFDRAYQFIELGSPVEFRIRLLGSLVRKKMKSAPPNPDAWPWMHKHFPHLRPDFILKSMPEGTDYIIKPVSDGRTIQFVLGRQAKEMPKLDLTRRAFRVKMAVAESMSKNTMAQNWATKRGKSLDTEGAERKVSAGKEGEPSVDDETMLERKRSEQTYGPDAFDGGSKKSMQLDADGRAVEEEQSPQEAVEKLEVVKKEMRKWRQQYDRASGIERRGMWGKAKHNMHTSKRKRSSSTRKSGAGARVVLNL